MQDKNAVPSLAKNVPFGWGLPSFKGVSEGMRWSYMPFSSLAHTTLVSVVTERTIGIWLLERRTPLITITIMHLGSGEKRSCYLFFHFKRKKRKKKKQKKVVLKIRNKNMEKNKEAELLEIKLPSLDKSTQLSSCKKCPPFFPVSRKCNLKLNEVLRQVVQAGNPFLHRIFPFSLFA